MTTAVKAIGLLLSLSAAAQTSLDAPPLALLLTEGRLTPVFGVAGNFILGEPGAPLLAYSFDSDIEWRLEEGRLTATRRGDTAVFFTPETTATFRGDVALLGSSGSILRFSDNKIEDLGRKSSEGQLTQLAGRTIDWMDGKLRIFQADGIQEEVACTSPPASMTAAGADWIHLTFNEPHRDALLHVARGRAGIYRLPRRFSE